MLVYLSFLNQLSKIIKLNVAFGKRVKFASNLRFNLLSRLRMEEKIKLIKCLCVFYKRHVLKSKLLTIVN